MQKNLIQPNIADTARNYLNTRYHFKGRSNGGLDCGGLIIKIIREYLVPDYNFEDYIYSSKKTHEKIINEFENVLNFTKLKEPEENSIFVIKLSKNYPIHIAIYDIHKNTIIHTYKEIGKVVEEPYKKYWQDKTTHIYKVL